MLGEVVFRSTPLAVVGVGAPSLALGVATFAAGFLPSFALLPESHDARETATPRTIVFASKGLIIVLMALEEHR